MVRHRRLRRLGICIHVAGTAPTVSTRDDGEIPMRVDRLTVRSTTEAQVLSEAR